MSVEEASLRALFEKLKQEIDAYLPPQQVELIYKSFLVAEKAHQGQMRYTGEPYITHPVAVAEILAGMRMDHETIIAALLHDVLEDTLVKKELLIAQFGEQVEQLVEGVSKLTQIEFKSHAEAQAENFRKMVLAMVRDIRVIIIKLADRLHNVRTLHVLPIEKQQRIALETLEIYAPVAHRLGMYQIRSEFEAYCFAAYQPWRHRVLTEVVKSARESRKEIRNVIETSLRTKFDQAGMPPTLVTVVERSLYSIYRMMRDLRMAFTEILDIYTFRIIVDKVEDCYRLLGAVHELYKPVPERFYDYIAIPKSNGYRALHTTLFGPCGVPIEIQILTHEMSTIAESGIVAHWQQQLHDIRSDGIYDARQRAQDWLRGLMEIQKSTRDPLEFIENVKIDLFPEEVYAFTPKGSIIELPSGATPVDFAYAVHTEIGNTCVAAKIDRKLAPLSTALVSGQTVEIITANGARPNADWLNFVLTGKARSNIRYVLKSQKRTESIDYGRQLLEAALSHYHLTLETVPKKNLSQVMKTFKLRSLDDLLESTGMGNQIPRILAGRLASQESSDEKIALDTVVDQPLLIKGSEGVVIHFAKCCYPIPGDPIVGILEPGQGIIVHVEQCKKVAAFHDKLQCIPVRWEDNVIDDFEVQIRIEILNQRGALAMLAKLIADAEANINDIVVDERGVHYAVVRMLIQVVGRTHLARVFRRLRTLKIVTHLERV